MSGGTREYVIGNYNKTAASSGFTIYPEKKYYDLYTVTSNSSCTIEECGGHALNETASWYSNYAEFVSSSYPWFARGGYCSYGADAGTFRFISADGGAYSDASWRSVLIPRIDYTVNFDTNGGNLEEYGINQELIRYTTSGEHEFIVPSAGEYMLEVWGAQGGTSLVNGSAGIVVGYGGYSVGTVFLKTGTELYINIGGKGTDGIKLTTVAGGYNGGGSGSSDEADDETSGGGGGATHIATISGELSTLSQYAGDINSPILIVAGGGSGASYTYAVGSGGGIYGGTTSLTSTSYPTQTSGYVFGKGQNGSGKADSDGVGGGGGGYTTTVKSVHINSSENYEIIIGAGGANGNGGVRGGTTSAFSVSAEGGYGGASNNGPGGAGGSGGGGSNGSNGYNGGSDGSAGGGGTGGEGQETTTREFGESTGILYAGGGGGIGLNSAGLGGEGGGGNGGKYSSGGAGGSGGGGGSAFTGGARGGSGGSGIVVIRNAR